MSTPNPLCSEPPSTQPNAEIELLRSDRCKEFLAMLSHELRNPLQPIRAAAAVLARQRTDGPEVERRAVAIIQRQVDHLARLVDDLVDGHSLVELLGGTVAVTAVATAPPVKAQAQKSRRVLLVDDNRDAAESLQALLEMEGHSVALAFTGQAALDQAARVRPEVVILDIGLSDISGYDLARRLRTHTGLLAPLLIALTGSPHEQERKSVREAGFDHHFVKPADPALLMGVLSA